MVEGKINDWFDHRRTFHHLAATRTGCSRSETEYRLYKWLKNEMEERFSLAEDSKYGATTAPAVPGVWKERQDAEAALTSYLSDVPSTSPLALCVSHCSHICRHCHLPFRPSRER